MTCFKSFRSAVCAALLFIGDIASASVVYTYIGNPLHPFVGSGPDYGPLSMSLTFSDDGATMVNWVVTQDNLGLISKADTAGITYSGLLPQLYLRTDLAGRVTTWYVSVYSPVLGSSNAYDKSVLSLYGQQEAQLITEPWRVSSWDLVTADSFIADNKDEQGTWNSVGSLQGLDFRNVGTLGELSNEVSEPPLIGLLCFALLVLPTGPRWIAALLWR